MNISGILVVVAPDKIDSTVETLNSLDGIDVHHIEQSSGRIIITQEAESIHDEIDGLKRVRALPGIVLAEMSYHSFEEDTENVTGIPEELEHETLDTVNAPID
ncbi:MAG: chaperone NapD [Pseudomonadota bacterium]|nr:chaperone NapD [Pseudomonadota bacterium]